MSSYEWHMLMAKYMIDIAKKSKPITSAYALLIAFEEIIDAYAAKEDKHFHEEYLAIAYNKRLEFMKEHKIINQWYELTNLCNLVVSGKYYCVNDMFRIIHAL